jgi:sec-independent protein translocase protein TatB
MFANLNVWEIGLLLLLALFIFGPERLPKAISDAVRMVRTVRDMARNATADLSKELGTEVRIEDLHPKTFIRKHLLSEEDEAMLRRPFDDAYKDLRQITAETSDYVSGQQSRTEPAPAPRTGESALTGDNSTGGTAGRPTGTENPRPYDTDAT